MKDNLKPKKIAITGGGRNCGRSVYQEFKVDAIDPEIIINPINTWLDKYTKEIDNLFFEGLKTDFKYLVLDIDEFISDNIKHSYGIRTNYAYSNAIIPNMPYHDLETARKRCDELKIDYMKLTFEEFIEKLKAVKP